MKLIIATRNAHKLEEINSIFNFNGLEIQSAFDFPNVPDVVEDGDTLEANAIKKAVTFAQAIGELTLSDDSGLEVFALNNEPGVYSARYSGENATDSENNEKLIRELSGKAERRAQFRTAIALAFPDGTIKTVEGKCMGKIIDTPRGEHGFGYDPLFVPDGYEQTFAELGAEIKNEISHRARALAAAAIEWEAELS